MKLPRRTSLHETSIDHNPRAFFRTATLACVAVAALTASSITATAQNNLPVCPLIATGGTIAMKIDPIKKAPVPAISGEDRHHGRRGLAAKPGPRDASSMASAGCCDPAHLGAICRIVTVHAPPCYNRFVRWRRAGVWGRIMDALAAAQYEAAFRENDIDETVLPGLTHETLKELGVASIGHRVKLLDAIAALRGDTSATAPSTDVATTPAVPSASPEDRAERRQVTVMFSDLVGSTALSARMDWRIYAKSFRPIRSMLRRLWGASTASYRNTWAMV